MTGNLWETPELVLDRVRGVGEIALDPCTNSTNPTQAKRIITAESDPDGLLSEWKVRADGGLCYVNPPYGRGHAARWAVKIVLEAELGCEIIALMRGDMSTQWARLLIHAARAVCFPPRIKFRGATGSPNFSNAIYYFGRDAADFKRAFRDFGPVVLTTPTKRKQSHDQSNP